MIRAAARRLAEHGSYLFFKHGARFHDPLVERQWCELEADPVLRDPGVLRVLEQVLLARLPDLRAGIYAPVPIARALERGEAVEEALEQFRYEMIRVDQDQVWWWQGQRVAPRLKRFFLDHLSYEPELGLYYFEYRVSADWYDKCYLVCELTPLVAVQVEAVETAELKLRAVLNNGRTDVLDPRSLRLDARERLFAQSREHGEVVLSDAARFQLLKGVTEDCRAVRIGTRDFPLRWPEKEPEHDTGRDSTRP